MTAQLGIGIGGDYPMSAAVVSDRANLNRRGLMLVRSLTHPVISLTIKQTFVFSMQGWGNFGASIVALVLLAIFKPAIQGRGEYGQFDAVWRCVYCPRLERGWCSLPHRLLAGLVLVPALGTLVQRMVLPESTKFKNVQALRNDPSLLQKGLLPNDPAPERDVEERSSTSGENGLKPHHDPEKIDAAPKSKETPPITPVNAVVAAKKNSFHETMEYFSEWRHLKTLIGTAGCWFLVCVHFCILSGALLSSLHSDITFCAFLLSCLGRGQNLRSHRCPSFRFTRMLTRTADSSCRACAYFRHSCSRSRLFRAQQLESVERHCRHRLR